MEIKETLTLEEFANKYQSADDLELLQFRDHSKLLSDSDVVLTTIYISKNDISDKNYRTPIYTVTDTNNIYMYSKKSDYLKVIESHIQKYIKQKLKKQPLITAHMNQLLTLEIKTLKNRFLEQMLRNPNHANSVIGCFRSNITTMQDKLSTVINYLNDKDSMKHLKNFGINFIDLKQTFDLKIKKEFLVVGESYSQEFLLQKEIEKQIEDNLNGIDYNSFEGFSDKINEIVLTQKTKRFIQKTFSQNYRKLINESTTDLIKELVMKDVSKSDFNQAFAKKLARYKDAEEFNTDLRQYVQQSQGWSMSAYIKQAESLSAEVHSTDNNVLCLRVDTYEQSEAMGSMQWCLSYNEGDYDSYRGHGSHMVFFVYDFNKDIDDNTAMIGMVINKESEVVNAHWKNDDEVENGMMMYYDKLPRINEKLSEKSLLKYIDSLDQGPTKKRAIFKNFRYLEYAPIIEKYLKNNSLNDITVYEMIPWFKMATPLDSDNAEYKNLRKVWKNAIINVCDDQRTTDTATWEMIEKVVAIQDMSVLDALFKSIKKQRGELRFDETLPTMELFVKDVNYKQIIKLLERHDFKMSEKDARIFKTFSEVDDDKNISTLIKNIIKLPKDKKQKTTKATRI